MKSPAVVWLLFIALLPTVPAEEEPFSGSDSEVRPERLIQKLPSGVTQQIVDEGTHQYSVTDI
ncbi:MAG: hypothetical protein ACFCU3_09235 [Verrucomicrobiales bacterium]